MKITLSRNDLLQATGRCQSVVEKRHTVPILANLLMRAEDNRLVVTATDLEVGLQGVAEARVEQAGETTAPARKLFDIVKELDPEQDVNLSTDGDHLMIQSGRARFKLAALDASEHPGLGRIEEGISIRIGAETLAEMISATAFAMSTDETRRYLTGTLFEILDSGQLRLVATDGHRLALSEASVGAGLPPRQCIVPRKAVTELRKLCEAREGTVELTLGERQVRLVADAGELVSKLIDQRFPLYQDVIPAGHPGAAIVDRESFDRALRRAMILANDFTWDIRLRFASEGIEVSAHNAEQEAAEEFVPASYEGAPVEIGFNGRYLRDALGAMHASQVRIELKDELSPVLLREETGGTARYVIMPMRIH
ncbi:MAG: DNA polymerase III subunit beta [Mariprofundaceae bacterium]